MRKAFGTVCYFLTLRNELHSAEEGVEVSNALLEVLREGNKRSWCMTPYCTTCGCLEYRNKLKELAGPLGGPLANSLEEINVDELIGMPKWQDGLLIAVIELPTSMQLEGVLKAWLPKARKSTRFVDYVLFKIVKHLPRQSETRGEWIDACMTIATDTKDFSLVESLILVLGQDARNYSQLLDIATDYAKTSAQMRRVLLNACKMNMKTDE